MVCIYKKRVHGMQKKAGLCNFSLKQLCTTVNTNVLGCNLKCIAMHPLVVSPDFLVMSLYIHSNSNRFTVV